MTLSPDDYIFKLRNTKVENELACLLRKEAESQRFLFIEELLSHTELPVRLVGLELIKRCLTDKNLIERLLNKGLQAADISEIKYWLNAITPKLGFRRVLSVVTEQLEEHEERVEKALFWLPSFLPDRNPKAVILLEELTRKFNSRSERRMG